MVNLKKNFIIISSYEYVIGITLQGVTFLILVNS